MNHTEALQQVRETILAERWSNPIPTNQLERLMIRWGSLHPYNVVDWAELPGTFDADRLKQSAEHILRESGMCGVMTDSSLKSFRIRSGQASIDVGTFETSWDDIGRYATDELNRPFSSGDSFPIRLAGVSTQWGQRIAMTFEHWLLDGYAAGSIFARIIRRYLGLDDSILPAFGTEDPSAEAALYNKQLINRELRVSRWPRLAWETVRSLCQLRSCYSPCTGDRKDLRVEVSFPWLSGDLLARLRVYCLSKNVTVNDVLMAALGEAILLETPERHEQRRRRDIALSCAVNLRQPNREALQQTPGVHLGFFRVICKSRLPHSFDEQLQSVKQQSMHAKRTRSYWQTVSEAAYSNWVWDKLPEGERVRHFMNNHPVAGGVSNLRHPTTWWRDGDKPILEHYQRAVPTGMMTPIALGITTVEGKLSLSVTQRVSGFAPRQADRVVERMIERIERL